MLPPFLNHDVTSSRSTSNTTVSSSINSKHRKPSQTHIPTIQQPEMLSLDLGPSPRGYTKDKKLKKSLYYSSQQSKWLKLFLIVVGLLFIFGYIPFFRFVRNTPNYKTHPSWNIKENQPHIATRDKIILYRIIGNDLPPRHKEGQTLSNLQFILDHEPSFPDTHKIFLLNRIIDPINEATIIRLLDSYHMDYIRVPFVQQEYEKLDFQLEKFPDADFLHSDDYRRFSKVSKLRALDYTYHVKNLYAMNNVSYWYYLLITYHSNYRRMVVVTQL